MRPGCDVELGGQAIENTEQAPLSSAARRSACVAAAVVLFIAFGSLLAMLLPIVTAIAGVGGGLMAIAPLTHAMNVVDFAPILGALIGLGVGHRLRPVHRHQAPPRPAVRARPRGGGGQGLNTSGRAVLFAGGTVCIALLGMLGPRRQLPERPGGRRPRSPSSSPCSPRSPCCPRCSASSGCGC